MAAAADGLHGAMFGHLKLQYGQIKHLTALNHAGKGQFLLARLALVGDAVDNSFFWAGWLDARYCPREPFVHLLDFHLQHAMTSVRVCSGRRSMVACWNCGYFC